MPPSVVDPPVQSGTTPADLSRRRQAEATEPPLTQGSAPADLSRTETACERWLGLLRQAMKDTDWTVDALAAQWKIDRAYVSRLVSGEKPWSLQRTLSLPPDLRTRLALLCAKAVGLIVVEPLSWAEAQRALVAGLVGVMGSQLPAATTGPIKADLRPVQAQKVSHG